MSVGQNVMTTGSAGALLTQVIFYFGHWPLAAPDMNTSAAIAGLFMLGIGALIHRSSLVQPDQTPKGT